MKRIKLKLIVLLSIICGFVFNAIYPLPVRASARDDDMLMRIKTLALAASQCLKEAGIEPVNANFSTNGLDVDDRSRIKAIFDLSDGFFKSAQMNSVVLGSYAEGGFRENFGAVKCKEIPLFKKVLELSDKYSQENADLLLCNGKEPGIITISLAGDGSDCQGNLDRLRSHYLNGGETISGKAVSIRQSNGAVDYFGHFMRDIIGVADFSGISQESLEVGHDEDIYWRNRDTFYIGCLKEGSSEYNGVPDKDATNFIGIYGAMDWKIHYFNKNDIEGLNNGSTNNYTVVYRVLSAGSKSCKEFAESIGASFSGGSLINTDVIKSLTLTTQEENIQSCKGSFEEVFNRWLSGGDNDFDKVADKIDDFRTTMVSVVRAAFSSSTIDGEEQKIDFGDYEYYYSRIEDLKETLRGEIMDFGNAMTDGTGAVLLSNDMAKTNMDLPSLINSLYTLLERATFTKKDDGWYIELSDDSDLKLSYIRYELDDVMKQTVKWARDNAEAQDAMWDKYYPYVVNTVNDSNYADYVDVSIDGGSQVVMQCKILDELIADLESLGLSVDGWTPLPPPNPGDWQEGNDGTVEPSCYDHAGSLGWILCTVLDFMTGVAEDAYNDYVAPALSVDPQLFSQDDSGTKSAWNVFQGFANILFIILLLVVIFSQLTGVGIDNYGIKKILPKMIVAAVLVNLSYWICLACVDLSNILGNGLQSLFVNLPPNGAVEVVGTSVGGHAVGQLISVGIIAALMAGGWAIITNPAALLALLVSVLGVVIAIFFLFVLLAAREAAIVVLVVISPLAFVCFMLPNTKKLFSKYLKLAEGLLLVYPIAGLLVGGGGYVSRLLLTSGFGSQGLVAAFTAMIVGVVPIFFIPTLLKGSFAAMGNIGAKISGIGKSMRGGAEKGIRNTDRYKNAQESGAMRRARLRAGIGRDGKESDKVWAKAVRTLGGKRNMARARSQYLKDQDTKKRMDSLMGVGFAAAAIGQQKKVEKDEVADYMTLINDKTRNGEETKDLYDLFDQYMREGNKAGAVAVARIAGRRKDTAADFLNKKITGYNSETGKISDVAKNYNAKTLSSVMKEVSTGENSGMYRQSAPLGFEFAAQYNKNYKEENGVPVANAVNASYSDWRNQANVSRALGNYVANVQDLVGMKGSSLEELNRLMQEENAMSAEDRARVQHLADSVIANRNKPGASWDSTKVKGLAALSSKYVYNEDTKEIELRPGFAEGGESATGRDASNNNNGGNSADFDVPRGGNGAAGGAGGGLEPQPGPQPQPQPRSQSESEGGGRIIISDNPNADWDALRGGRR